MRLIANMAAQLPPEVVGVAAGVLIYSLICLASGIFLLWLVWVHDERKSCEPLVSRSVPRLLMVQTSPCWAY